ncbi:alkaline phosphatase-like [Ischnura elegans]|uniref:alkaline phosphatase-like n=1 Tax=Ischnura elegans TaxID=197161 RepID=UPI001ED89BBB|nr:alkaline phosphatase-like [Ischnura elegans]
MGIPSTSLRPCFAVALLLLALLLATDARPNDPMDPLLINDDYRMHPKISQPRKRSIPTNGRDEDDASYWEDVAKGILSDHLHRQYIRGVAKNVIMFLGDGMSVPTVSAARVYEGQLNGKPGEENTLSFEKFPFAGFSKTYCVDHQVADSACTATSYLGGVKTNLGVIGVTGAVKRGNCTESLDMSTHVHSIMKWAQDAGKSTGVVTTTRITHASPTGAYGHVAERNWESDADVVASGEDPDACSDIAEQLVRGHTGYKLNVIMGGGRKNFRPKGVLDEENFEAVRLDGVDLIEEWTKKKAADGSAFKYVWNKEDLAGVQSETTDYLLGLFAGDHMDYNLKADHDKDPSLREMTEKAIEILQKNENGFVLFVEGGRVDHAHHDTMAHLAVDETVEMAKAVQAAVDKTNEADTLIVVTADHAHTMSYAGYPQRGHPILHIGGTSDVDDLPYSTLSYANGPGYKHPMSNGDRYDISKDDMNDVSYHYPGTVPLGSETHGGDDVAVYARGPWSELFTGSFEQNFIMHAMCYAAQIGPAASWGPTPRTRALKSDCPKGLN